MKQIKVIHLIEDLKIGGYEQLIAAIATHLDNRKFNLEVWCLARGGATAEALIHRGITVKILKLNNYHNPFNIWKLTQYIRQSKPDIIHSHTYFSNTFSRLASLLICKPIKKVIHFHNVTTNLNRRHIFIEKFLDCFTDQVICCSEMVKEYWTKKLSLQANKTTVIYNGIDPEKILTEKTKTQLRAHHGFKDSDIILTTISSLRPVKNPEILFDAIPALIKKNSNIKILIIGDGPLREQLQQRVLEGDYTSIVKFCGVQNNVNEWLKLSDIYCSATCLDGFSVALVEAMFAGLPVVAIKTSGAREIIRHHENGLLAEPSADSLAENIQHFIDNPAFANKYGQAAQLTSQQFTINKIVKKFEDLYLKLL